MKTPTGGRTLILKLLLRSDFTSLGKLINSRAKIAVDDTYIWVRYESDDERVASLATCMNGRHFRLLDTNRLVPLESTIATEQLPKMEWRDLNEVVKFKLPTAALSGRFETAELPELQLIRGGAERPASAGLFSLEGLVSWIEGAPQFRLRRLAACVSQHEVLVVGNPLPPIACEYLCQEGRLLTPAGMTWYPRIDAALVLEHFDVGNDRLLLWTKTEQWSSIPLELVKPLRRGSFRSLIDNLTVEH